MFPVDSKLQRLRAGYINAGYYLGIFTFNYSIRIARENLKLNLYNYSVYEQVRFSTTDHLTQKLRDFKLYLIYDDVIKYYDDYTNHVRFEIKLEPRSSRPFVLDILDSTARGYRIEWRPLHNTAYVTLDELIKQVKKYELMDHNTRRIKEQEQWPFFIIQWNVDAKYEDLFPFNRFDKCVDFSEDGISTAGKKRTEPCTLKELCYFFVRHLYHVKKDALYSNPKLPKHMARDISNLVPMYYFSHFSFCSEVDTLFCM